MQRVVIHAVIVDCRTRTSDWRVAMCSGAGVDWRLNLLECTIGVISALRPTFAPIFLLMNILLVIHIE